VALIVQALRAARALAGSAPRLVVTGGGVAAIAALLPAGARHEPDLVLCGLAVLTRSRRPVRIESLRAPRIPDVAGA
jgi:pantothenate kinase type III